MSANTEVAKASAETRERGAVKGELERQSILIGFSDDLSQLNPVDKKSSSLPPSVSGIPQGLQTE